MSTYYVSGVPFGDELYHHRTKGSKNGVSTTPGYKAVGKLAEKAEDVRNTVQNVSSAIAGSSNSSSAGRHYADPNGDPSKVGHSSAARKWARNRRFLKGSTEVHSENELSKQKRMKKTIEKGKKYVDKFMKNHNKP